MPELQSLASILTLIQEKQALLEQLLARQAQGKGGLFGDSFGFPEETDEELEQAIREQVEFLKELKTMLESFQVQTSNKLDNMLDSERKSGKQQIRISVWLGLLFLVLGWLLSIIGSPSDIFHILHH